MTFLPRKSIGLYLAGAAALAGSAHGAVVYQSFELTLQDTDPTVSNLDATLGVIAFDGTSITLAHTSSGGGIALSADDTYLGTSTKVTEGTRTVSGSYLQTSSILTAGQAVVTGFATTPAPTAFTGSATDQYVGVSTPSGQLGWVRFSYTTDGASLTIHDAAFQTAPGAIIDAGTLVPEPGSAALLGLAGGLVALRRRRRTA